MSVVGFILACWLVLAALAFAALSAFARAAARGDVESDLGIAGEAELRLLRGAQERAR